MAESEKMAALKKAYADIILNTAKESAARIMVSERKAVRFEKDLSSTKDEALRLLLNLKRTIDSTTKEAEVTSSTKQRKIDVLEAQLNEAEDVITDLRSELRWVRDKLDKVKINPLQLLNGQIMKEDAHSHENEKVEPITPSISNSRVELVTASDMGNCPLNHKIMDNRCCSTTQQTENSSVSQSELEDLTPNLASTIMRSNESEPYRNGCSQRICALESILPNGELPQLGDEDGQRTVVNKESIIDKAIGKCAVSSHKTKKLDTTKKPSGAEVKKWIRVLTSRRKKACLGKSKASVCRSPPGQPKKPSHSSSAPSHCKPNSVDGNVRSEVSSYTPPPNKAGNVDNVKTCSDLDEKLLQKRSFNEEENKFGETGKENVRVKCWDATAISVMCPPSQLIKPCQPSSVVNRDVVYSFSILGNVKSCEDGLRTSDNEAKMKPLLRLDPGLTLIRSGVDPVSGSKNVTLSIKALNKCRLVQKAEERDTELRSETALVKPDGGGAVENSMVVCSELDGKLVNVPVVSDSKDSKSSVETDGSPSTLDFNRVLKYTFQRKRKKESLSMSGENTSPDKTIMKRRAAERLNNSQEPEKSTLISESSRDSRRIAQVARQLISLSGRRW